MTSIEAFGLLVAAVIAGSICVYVVAKLADKIERDSDDFEAGLAHGVRIARKYKTGRLSKKGVNRIRQRTVCEGEHSASYIEGFCAGIEGELRCLS